MSKARGWWRVTSLWPARFVGKTDDDCVIDLPRLTAILRATPGEKEGRPVYGGAERRGRSQLACADYMRSGMCGALAVPAE